MMSREIFNKFSWLDLSEHKWPIFDERYSTALKVTALSAFGDVDTIMDLYVETETAFPTFDIAQGQSIALEPVTKFHFEELIEIPKNTYDAFRLELRVSAIRGGIFKQKDRKWRAFTMILNSSNNNEQNTDGAIQ